MTRLKTAAKKTSSSKPPSKVSAKLLEKCFPNPALLRKYEQKYATMPIKHWRQIDFECLVTINFPYLARFEHFGWTRFLQNTTPIPPTLVRAFFSNAKLKCSPNRPCNIIGFETQVLGKEMYINTDELSQILSIAATGLTNEEIEVPLEFPIVKDRASDLPMYLRLLHLIITWNLRPFGSRHSSVRRLDRFWLHNIHSEQGMRLDLCHFVFTDWVKIIEGSASQIVFPHHVASVLKHFGVNILVEPSAKPSSKNKISFGSLHHMGYERRTDGTWHKVAPERPEPMVEDDAPAAVDPTAAGTSSAPPVDVPPASASSAGSSDIVTILADLREHFDSRFDHVDTRFNALGSRVDSLAEDLQALRTHVDDISTYQQAQFEEATERQDMMFDEIQTSQVHIEELLDRVPPP